MKNFKTSKGLEQHGKTHIDTTYTKQVVYGLVPKAKACELILLSRVHAGDICEALEAYTHSLLNYLNTVKMNNVENLYNRLFNDVMKNSGKYFQLAKRAFVVLSTKFVEVLISSKNKDEMNDNIVTKNLTEKEIAGLQYLGGYVL